MTCITSIIRPDQALHIVRESSHVSDARTVASLDAAGLRLAEDVAADRDYPPFGRAMMDGYAVRLADAKKGRTLKVAGLIAAGDTFSEPVTPGTCVEIMTGAACPPDAEAVVPKELIVRDGDSVTLSCDASSGQHIAPRGSECRVGEYVLRTGDLLSPLAVGILFSVGRRQVRVIPRPKVGVLTTGGELIGEDTSPSPVQIRDSNGPMLVAMARARGVSDVVWRHSGDDLEAIITALQYFSDCDVIVMTGGVSTGRYDLVPESVRRYGAETVFHKVSQKPGKPLLFARRGRQLIFGLPGNPLAAHLCFHRYVSAAIGRLSGQPAGSPDRQTGFLREPLGPGGDRTWFMLARAEQSETCDAPWELAPLPGHSSADLFNTQRANCYVEVPAGAGSLAAGTAVSFEWLAMGAGQI